jgi:hypothetical protein
MDMMVAASAFLSFLNAIAVLTRILNVPRCAQRWHTKGRFASNAECLAAAGQDTELRAGAQECLGQLRTGIDQVLTIIEHQQECAGAQIVGEHRQEWPTDLFAQPERARNRQRHQQWISQRCQFDQPDTIGKLFQLIGGDVQRQAGLAGAARTGQRDQALAGEQFRDCGALLRAPNKAGELRR